MDKRILLMEKACEEHVLLMEAHGTIMELNHKNNLLTKFCIAFNDLINTINPKSNNIFNLVFKNNINLKKKKVLDAHLIIARIYLKKIINEIQFAPHQNFSLQYVSIAFDCYPLLKSIEHCYNGLVFKGRTGTRNMQIDSNSAFDTAMKLFSPMEEASYSFGAYTIFGIRQALELGSKEIIGLENIIDQDGKIFKYGSQIPWDFLVTTSPHPFLRLLFNPTHMYLINKWAHSFVHTGRNSFCFTVSLALETVGLLYTNVKAVDNYGSRQFYHSTLIINSEKFKKNFEDYLKRTYPNKSKTAKWLPMPKLSTVMTLFNHPIITNDFSRFPLFPNIPPKRNYANTGQWVDV